MAISATDLENAQRIVKEAGSIRTEVERSLILAGAWEGDAVDKVLSQSGDTIAVNGGKVVGIDAAILQYRDRNPDAFAKLSPKATNENLPAMQRFMTAYQEVLKVRDRRKSLQNVQARTMDTRPGYGRGTNR